VRRDKEFRLGILKLHTLLNRGGLLDLRYDGRVVLKKTQEGEGPNLGDKVYCEKKDASVTSDARPN